MEEFEGLEDMLTALPLSGDEEFAGVGGSSPSVLAFWRWAYSNVVDNTQRAVLAEFLVAWALGLTVDIRQPWHPFDLRTRDGITIEVKSGAFLQRWRQRKPSEPKFGISGTYAEDPETAQFAREKKRQAQVYVFALYHHRAKASANPLDTRQWSFFVVPTGLLDAKLPTARSITLPQLAALGIASCEFGDLPEAVAAAAHWSVA